MTTSTNVKVQFRGICQCCGREQAVLKTGRMSKHGYTVDHGWFNGVCSGQNHKPMEQDRAVADQIVAQVRKEVAELRELAEAYKAGTKHPARVTKASTRPGEPKDLAWEDADEYQRDSGLRMAIFRAESRARTGEAFANDLEALADRFHGQACRVVNTAEAPAPIRTGEKRTYDGRTITVTRVDGARVYWTDERGFKSWTGTQAFRKLPFSK